MTVHRQQPPHSSMSSPRVYLVGAGPGPQELMTVKGLNCMKQAHTVCYDREVAGIALAFSTPDTEMIPVDEADTEVLETMIGQVREGRTLVRLLAGDPMFTRQGPETALALEEADIAFEIVPGIPPETGISAYAGIPLVYGKEDAGVWIQTVTELDIEAMEKKVGELAASPGTLLIRLQAHQLTGAIRALIHGGRDAASPAAVVCQGTSVKQRTLSGHLGNLEERMDQLGSPGSCVLVSGQGVLMQPALSWMERKPLFGKKVLVPRTIHQASALSQRLQWMGAQVLELPVVEIRHQCVPEQLQRILERLVLYHHLICTSQAAVEAFLEALKKAGHDVRRLTADLEVVAIGQATARALERSGILPDRTIRAFTAEGVLQVLEPLVREGHRILMPRSDQAKPRLLNGLKGLGADVDDLSVYSTVIPEVRPAFLQELLDETPDWVTFTSPVTVHHLMEMLQEAGLEWPRRIQVAVIGPTTAQAAEQHELDIHLTAADQTVDGLVESICRERTTGTL